jgi:hypothetical protein
VCLSLGSATLDLSLQKGTFPLYLTLCMHFQSVGVATCDPHSRLGSGCLVCFSHRFAGSIGAFVWPQL